MSDLPARLRAEAHDNTFRRPEIMNEAADHILQLEAELAACPFHDPTPDQGDTA